MRRREALLAIPAANRLIPAPGTNNYEAQQPPLGYVPLAAIDSLGRSLGLRDRVRLARLYCALAGGGLQIWLTMHLASRLSLAREWRALTLFLLTGVQMFHATFSRVSNDWLAVPLGTVVILAAIRCDLRPGLRSAGLLGLALAAGLLTKAYFLVWVVFGAGFLVAQLTAGRAKWTAILALTAGLFPAAPWYGRNIALYGNLTGTLQAKADVGPSKVLAAAREIPWPSTIYSSLHGALWTGNNSFTSFSIRTLDVVLLLTGSALLLWFARSFSSVTRRQEWTIAWAALTFGASLLYANAMFYAQARASYYTATPWYAQTLGPALACLVVLGAARSGVAGRWLAAALAALTGYLVIATFWVKLIPMYSGCQASRVSLTVLAACYRGQWWDSLAESALGPAVLLVPIAACSALFAAACILFFRPNRFPVPKRGSA